MNELKKVVDNIPEDALEAASYAQYKIRPAMDAARAKTDAAEELVNDEYWPFPKYKDMLYDHHTQASHYE